MYRPMLIVRLFQRAARIQSKRMTLTVMAIAWGTISIVLLLSFGEGLKRSMEDGNKGTGSGILVVWPGRTDNAFEGFGPGRQVRFLPEDTDLLVGRIPEIESISGEMVRWGTQLAYGRNVLNKKLVGAEPEFGPLRNHYPEPGGRFINDLDQRLKRRVIFLGFNLKKDLFGDRDPVGERVLVGNAPFTVIGVMREKKQMGMYGGPDEDHAVIPLSTFQALLGDPYLDDMVVKPKDVNGGEYVKRRINEVLGAKYKYDPEDPGATHVWDTIESARTLGKIMVGIEVFLGVIGGLTLLIGGVGVANIMYAVVKQRTHAIGVQMAIGARRSAIMGPIVMEALSITALGGAMGISLGYLMVRGLGFVQSRANSEALEFIGEPTFSMPIALATVTLLGMIGMMAGYFPSRRAATVQPAVALRHE
ncbi:MAG: ABC transporter permease [Candidatus Eisenbacteria bacterium]